MHRKALIVSGAAGPQDVANSVLQRFGFAQAVSALSVTDAAGRLRTEKYDLIVIPLQGLDQHELSAFERDLPERVGDARAMTTHVSAWEKRRNGAKVKADWQFTTPDARVKLRKLYPTVDG